MIDPVQIDRVPSRTNPDLIICGMGLVQPVRGPSRAGSTKWSIRIFVFTPFQGYEQAGGTWPN